MPASTQRRTSRRRPARRRRRTVALTAAYLPAPEGGYTAEVLEALGVHSQGETFDEARENLHDAVALMLEEAPGQFGVRAASAPPGALLERMFVVLAG